MPDSPGEDADTDGSFAERRARWCSLRDSVNLIGVSQVGLFVLALGYVLHVAKPVLLPLVLAVLASLVLQPVYRGFRRIRFPRFLASAATVAGLIAIIGFGAWQIALPGAKWMRNVDEELVSLRMQEVFRPMKKVGAGIKQVADKVEQVTRVEETDRANGNGAMGEKANDAISPPPLLAEISPRAGTKSPAEPESVKPVVVEIREDSLATVLSETRAFGVLIVAFLFLVLFILAYGNRIVRCLGKDEGTAAVLSRMGSDVSRYLFTITVINACLGLAVGTAMWALGMPNAVLWGVLAMVLNYVPYVGALAGTLFVFVAAASTFDEAWMVLVLPATYFALTAMEGNLVTPLVLGGRFRLNPLVVFVWIFAWGAFWGIAGMLIAMPALVTFKIVCENTATMEKFRRVLES